MKYWILAIIFCATSVFAQPAGRIQPRPYFRGDLGVAITEDADAEFIPGTVGTVSMELDPGIRFGAAGGAFFGDYFALELETGWIINEVDSITGFDDVDAWVYQVPFLVNAAFEFRNNTGLTPFIGAGAGGNAVGIEIDDADNAFVSLDGEESDFVFAWQVFGGLKFDINDQLSVGLIYRYLWSDDAEWEVDDTAQDIEFDGARTHMFSAMVSFRF